MDKDKLIEEVEKAIRRRDFPGAGVMCYSFMAVDALDIIAPAYEADIARLNKIVADYGEEYECTEQESIGLEEELMRLRKQVEAAKAMRLAFKNSADAVARRGTLPLAYEMDKAITAFDKAMEG